MRVIALTANHFCISDHIMKFCISKSSVAMEKSNEDKYEALCLSNINDPSCRHQICYNKAAIIILKIFGTQLAIFIPYD